MRLVEHERGGRERRVPALLRATERQSPLISGRENTRPAAPDRKSRARGVRELQLRGRAPSTRNGASDPGRLFILPSGIRASRSANVPFDRITRNFAARSVLRCLGVIQYRQPPPGAGRAGLIPFRGSSIARSDRGGPTPAPVWRSASTKGRRGYRNLKRHLGVSRTSGPDAGRTRAGWLVSPSITRQMNRSTGRDGGRAHVGAGRGRVEARPDRVAHARGGAAGGGHAGDDPGRARRDRRPQRREGAPQPALAVERARPAAGPRGPGQHPSSHQVFGAARDLSSVRLSNSRLLSA